MEKQDTFASTTPKLVIRGENAGNRIAESIENNEFILLYQLIAPLDIHASNARHYEVFVRLIEEEENLSPPGEFFPLAEKHGLMPALDRWVVKHVLDSVSGSDLRGVLDEGSLFFVNLAGATIRDPEFPEFVKQILYEYGMAGTVLCFEIPGSELTLLAPHVARFIKAIREIGCRVAISGFGRDKVSFELLRGFQVDFVKIDGSIIIRLHRDLVDQAKTTAINQIARKNGIKTIAEFVEDEETIAKLKEIGVDFGQGFGISKPCVFEKSQGTR